VSGRLPFGAGLRRPLERARAHLLRDRPPAVLCRLSSRARVSRQALVRLSKAALLPVLLLLSVGVWLGIGLVAAVWLR
jgi:hypothetical protein